MHRDPLAAAARCRDEIVGRSTKVARFRRSVMAS
jgi:hypothetical protein